MLRKVRIIIAAISFVLVSLLFLDFTNTLHCWLSWLAKIQFIPALLALNICIIFALIALTLLFGRIYCSLICPLGIFQDVISWIAGKRKKNRFAYSKALSWLRYGVLVLFCAAFFIAGFKFIFDMLEPYSAYGRIASGLFAPAYQWINNLFAHFAERIDSYAFYTVDIWLKSLIVLITPIVTFFLVTVLAWRHGRTYCNTICPVGTVLGFISKFAIFKPRIDTQKCNNCKLCERRCKASCIKSQEHKIDYSRCVSCMDCIKNCSTGAMTYTVGSMNTKSILPKKGNTESDKDGISRRKVLSIFGIFALTGAAKAQQLYVDGGLATIEDKKRPERKIPLVPPGAESVAILNQKCTACQLCISACPNKVLHPSNKLSTFMHPEMSYEKGFCRPECVECSQICPTGAIKPVSTAQKSAISIGQAVWVKKNCVVHTDNIQCNSCAKHCPTGAIRLVATDDSENSLKTPVIDRELCIGCGACEHYCPARPFSAIFVEGNVKHHSI